MEMKILCWGAICVIGTLDKRGGKPLDIKSINKALIKTHNLLDTWRHKNPDSFGPTWTNPQWKYNVD